MEGQAVAELQHYLQQRWSSVDRRYCTVHWSVLPSVCSSCFCLLLYAVVADVAESAADGDDDAEQGRSGWSPGSG